MRTAQSSPGHKRKRRQANVACGLQILGVLLCGGQVAAEDVTYEVLHSLGPLFPDGALPSSLVQGCDGSLFGITDTGGAGGAGTVFRLNSTRDLTTLHSFDREGGVRQPLGLIKGTDGNLYGTTIGWSKATHAGTIFKVDPAGVVSTLHAFAPAGGFGSSPRVHFQASDGSLYGTTFLGGAAESGTIFKLDPAGSLTTLHSFDIRSWHSTLIEGRDGKLYGTTGDGGVGGKGTIYRLVPEAEETFTTLHSFSGPDGAFPHTLVEGSDGSLYGTTDSGGASGIGTVFKLDPQVEGSLTTIYSFSRTDLSQPNTLNTLIAGSDGWLYGTTSDGLSGTVFKTDTAGHFETLRSFSAYEEAGLPRTVIQGSDDVLYGTTAWRGGLAFPIVYNPGTVFKIDREGLSTTVHAFSRQEILPRTLIQDTDGSLYGTTGSATGPRFKGAQTIPATVFKVDVDGRFTVLGSPGGEGLNTLIQGNDGDLYGTSLTGGAKFRGAIFKLDPAGNLATLYSFAGADLGGSEGSAPGTLLQGSDGNLYGTTSGYFGEAPTIFKLDVAGTLTTLYTFAEHLYDDLALNTLVQGSDGDLYGVTFRCCQSGGTIFKLELAARKLITLHSFVEVPKTIFRGRDGCLYGTTVGGWGSSDRGTIFKLDSEGNLTTLYAFSGAADGNQANILVPGNDGNLYGTSFYGTSGIESAVFKLDREGNLTVLSSFVEPSATYLNLPTALIQGHDGDLYGTTELGGQANGGVVFRLRLPPSGLQRPGDCNQDGKVDVSDAVCLLGFLFLASPASLPCGDGASADPANHELLDWNDDAVLDLSDAVGTLNWLFLGGPPHALGSGCRSMSGCPDACAAF